MSSQQLKRISQFVPPGSTLGRQHGSKNKRLQVIPQAELAQQLVSSGLVAAGPASIGPAPVVGGGSTLLSVVEVVTVSTDLTLLP